MKYLSFFLIFLVGCVTSTTSKKNYYPFDFDDELHNKIDGTNVMIMPLDLVYQDYGSLSKAQGKILTQKITEYLEQNGFNLVSYQHYRQITKEELAKNPNLYDPKTGNPDTRGLGAVQDKIRNRSREELGLDYIIIPKVLFHRVDIEQGSKRAYWNGTTEKLRLNRRLSGHFGTATAISLNILIWSFDNKSILYNVAGIELYNKQNYDPIKLNVQLVPRDDIFENTSRLEQAIKIAFHPFINYPEFGM